MNQTDFLTVARAALQRGFKCVIPVDDKKPLLRRWTQLHETTESDLIVFAKDFPTADVGIVLKGHAGSVFVWDVDADSIVERMQQETGRTLPDTYTVQSRPLTAPFKRHIYFRQTSHFASLFPKQANLDGYDIKGMGGGHVVAEGCVRHDTGEVRTGNALSIIDIPDWLADWLHTDRAKSQRPRQARADTKPSRLTTGLIPVGHRTQFLRRRAKWLVRFNLTRQEVYSILIRQCRELCDGGVAMVQTRDGKRKIRDIAFDRSLKAADPTKFIPRERTQHAVVRENGQTRIVSVEIGFASLLRQKVAALPDTVTSSETYRQLDLNPKARGDQARLRRAMLAGGFCRHGGRRGDTVWTRLTTYPNGVSSKNIGEAVF